MSDAGSRVPRTPRAVVAAVALALAALAGCGDDGGRTAAAGNGADRAFVADMVPHHASAVEMAEVAQERGESRFVRELAADIVRTQNEEIEVMRREDRSLEQAGVDPGDLGVEDHMKGMGMDASTLETASPFDRAFLEMMIPHHQGAVTMARAELEQGQDPELKALAQDVVAAQEAEIAAMREHLGGAGEEGHAGH